MYASPQNDEHHTLLDRYAKLVGRPQVLIPSYESAKEKGSSAKVLIMTSDPDKLIEAAREEFHPEEFNIIKGSPDPFFVEFLRPEVSKGSALKSVCKHLEIDIDEVIAFGDGDNDKEMLKEAGRGFAMKNAKPMAKDAADEVLQVAD